MRQLFDSLKKRNLIREILRYSLGFIFIIFGIVLGFFYGTKWIIIGIFLCMVQSVIILSTLVIKNNKWDKLINETFVSYMPESIISKSNDLNYAYMLFDLKNITSLTEVLINQKINSNGISISCATIKCRFNGRMNLEYIRLYAVESLGEIDLSKINNERLDKYRYEFKENNLYLLSIVSKEDSLYPKDYSTYDKWIMSIKDEMFFIDCLTKKAEEIK